MALFSRTKKKAEVVSEKKAPKQKVDAVLSPRSSAILSVRVTEKATKESELNTYTFNVAPNATKTEIKETVQKLYKVTPIKVSVVPVRAKKLFQRGKYGRTSGGKKAYVTLKKGDQIEFV